MLTESLDRETDRGSGIDGGDVISSEPMRPSRIPDTARDRLDSLAAQVDWAARPVAHRLAILKRTRHELASRVQEVADSLPPRLARTSADTIVAELFPLLEAIRFLEREAPRLLLTRRLGRSGLPFWLSGVEAEVQRVCFGRVLIIGPSNYPLFLPGVQAFQALAAGNAVIWKPGLGGAPVANLVAEALYGAGLPKLLLQITEDTIEAAQSAIADGVDKVFFTGSGGTGRLLLRQLAEMATPCVVELSGNDAVVVLPSADLDRVVAALAFGMRLNGSATCMAPRRILLVDCPASRRDFLIDKLSAALAEIEGAAPPASTRRQLAKLVSDAVVDGATVVGDPISEPLRPVLLLNCNPRMQVCQADIFAPVLSLIEVKGTAGVLAAQAECPLALTTSIFGEKGEARSLSRQIACGTVVLNDLIVPTADPRIPFGGRRKSGFGVTRGAEGLLEMTAIKVVTARRNNSSRHYEATGEAHAAFFGSILTAAHSGRFGQRLSSLKRAMIAAMELKKQ